MRLKLPRLLAVTCFFLLTRNISEAQNCVPTGLNHSTITSLCNQVCRDLTFKVPDLRSTSDYTLISIPYAPYAYTPPGASFDNRLYNDDSYSNIFDLPFPFCFYDQVYTQAVISSNGLVTFDISRKILCENEAAWDTRRPIPNTADGDGCGENVYPRASIMGVFMDLDPRTQSSSPNKKIEWRVEGTAPCRRFVVSFFEVGVFQNKPCGEENSLTTFQIVMTESTGVIDVFIKQKICDAQSSNNFGNGPYAILGIQNWQRDKWVAAPGKNATKSWKSINEGYRFVPTGGSSRFVNAELLALDHTPIAVATTANTTPGLLDLTFPNICTPGNSTQYVLRTSFAACDNAVTLLEAFDTITINRPPDLNATANTSNTLCGSPTGVISVNTPAGLGTPPFTATLNPGPGQIVQTSPTTPIVFNNVAQGVYTVEIKDAANNCYTTLTNITVDRTNDLAANVTAVPTTCAASSDGKITVTPTTGSAPYTFSLDSGTPITAPAPYTFTGVAANAHNIIVTDASGCVTASIPITVASGPQLDANAVATATSCSGASNGTITVTPTNGTAPFSFSLDSGTPITATAPYTFTGVSATAHTIVVTDASLCSTSPIPVTVAAGPALTTTASKTDVLCNGNTNGTITVAVPTIGTAPYEYSLNNVTWQSSNVFTGLAANTYTVYFREFNGCQGSTSVTIDQPAVLATTKTITPVVCNGESNGIINITTTGGTLPYQYSIDGGTTWQGSNIFNVPANTFTVTIKDANNCITTQPNMLVTQPAVLTASSVNTTASCDGGADGTITVTATGGNTSYQYSIDGTNFQSSNVFNVLANTYTVTVKDNLGCTFSFPTTVTMLGNLTFTPQIDPTICEGKSTNLELVSNATIYEWSPATGLSSTTVYNPVANPTVTTPYTVKATLGLCSVTDIVIVNVNTAPIPDAGAPGFICYGQSYTLQGSGGVKYSWTPTTYLDNPLIRNPVAAALKTTTYTLSIVEDANGCGSLVTDDVIVDVTPPIKVTTFPYDTIGYPMDQFMLDATSIAPNYVWSPSIGLSDPNIHNPLLTIGNIGEDRLYQVTAFTNAGCKGEGYVRVRVYKGPDIYVPTGFTPNNDGKNDTFYPFPVGIKSLNYFKVFNRWGQLVFSSTTLNKGWDGKLLGAEQATGTYAWMAEAVTKDNKVITKKGTVTLIR